jgi:predicted RNA-binding protein with PUA-like domain
VKSAQDYLPTRYWLMKSEPDVFSIDDLMRVGEEPWTGVRNYQARNFMRDQMRVGHHVLFYHSNTQVPGIVGTARVVSEAEPDATSWDPSSPYFDPKSTAELPRWFCVRLGQGNKFSRPVTLACLKADAQLTQMLLIRPGQRLSVQPVSEDEFNRVLELAQEPLVGSGHTSGPRSDGGARDLR